MDIRTFFKAAKKKDQKSTPKAASNDAAVEKKTSFQAKESSKKPKPSAKEPTSRPSRRSSKSPAAKDPKPSRAPPKKDDVIELSDDDDEPKAVVSTTRTKKSGLQSKVSPKATKKKRSYQIVVDSSDDEMEVDHGEKSPTARGKVPESSKKRAAPPSNKVDVSYTEPRKKQVTKSSPPKAKQVKPRTPTAKTPPKKALIGKPLEPTLELDNFDLDACVVPQCLEGLTFVFTGMFDELSREESADLVKSLGGRVTTAVSSKTTYLVAGEILEDGRPYTEGAKFKKASALSNVQVVLGEKKMYGLFHLYEEKCKQDLGLGDDTQTTASLSQSTSSAPISATSSPPPPKALNPYAKKASSGAAINPYATKGPIAANPYAKASKTGVANPYAMKNKASESIAARTSAPVKVNNSNQLWVDKHAPTSTHEILGNKDSVGKLRNWLMSWERTFNNQKAAGKTFSNPRGPWKGALLSGPPGIGKTTTATLVAKEAGRDLLEFNASDARSKKALQTGLGDVTGSQTLSFGKENSNKKPSQKLRCIIMDEVDGMGAGDRSGMAELILMIKKSKVPIICICNDRQSQKMKSLLPYCMDLRFRRPVKSVMANRAIRIAQIEGLDVERNAAEAIAESCGNDVRQVINCLQMWANKKGGDRSLTYKGLKDRQSSIKKDEILRVSLFDAAKTVVEGRRNVVQGDKKSELDSFYKRNDAFFVDYSMVGLLVQQNYLKVMVGPFNAVNRSKDDDKNDTEMKYLETMYKAAESMSDYAVAEQAIRGGDQNWSLLPFSGILTLKTGFHAGGAKGGMVPGFPEFTAWMGKNSTKGKKQRLLEELQYHMNYRIHGGTIQLRQLYLPVFRDRFMSILKVPDAKSNQEAIQLMDTYGLSKDDVMEKFDEFRLGGDVPAFSSLDSKQRAGLTREYNKGSHKSQALVEEQVRGTKTKRKGKKEKSPADLDAIDEDDASEASDDEDDEEDLAKLQAKFKPKRAARGSKKATKAAPKSRKK